MIPNLVRQKWASGEAAINGWLSIACPFTAEIMAAQGYDSVTVDLQHGLVGYEAATAMLQAMRASGVAPMVRVPWLDPSAVMKALDAGAYGIICPMVNNGEEARRLVSYMRYPPRGIRSFGPTRANFSAGSDYGQHADEQVICFAMIETQEGYDRLDEIVSTPGLDSVYIGPADLALGLAGRRFPIGFDREERELVEAIRIICERAHSGGIRAAMHCGMPAYAAKAIGWGFDLVTVSNDVRLLAGAAQASVASVRKLIGEAANSAAAAAGGY
jgi:4-hydroxy-2-oxoheptanedioate aldolase